MYDAAIFIGVVVTDTAATDVEIAFLPRIQTGTTDCWPYYLTDGPSGTAQYRGASIAIVLGGEPATCLCCPPFPFPFTPPPVFQGTTGHSQRRPQQ